MTKANEKIVISELIGGLGNQMFQYAAGLGLAHKKAATFKIDSSGFSHYKLHGFDLEKWSVDAQKASHEEIQDLAKRKLFILPSKKFKEKSLAYDERFFSLTTPVYLSGYWQTEKYFKDIRNELLKKFVPKNPLSDFSKNMMAQIENAENSISLHVRRGDYLQSKNQSIHGTCTLDYYQKSILYFEDKYTDITFFVFSDDIAWAKANLKFNSKVVYVDGNGAERNHEDIYLMSKCRHNIIANSSFSWWGAWLNNYPQREVVAPANWFVSTKLTSQDIFCKEWLRF